VGRDGQVRLSLESTGTPLGVSPTHEVMARELIALESGDTLVLVTDGVVESQAPDGSLFGSDGLLASIRAHREGSAGQMLQALIADSLRFTGSAPQVDDLCAIICKVGPTP